ncbi:peptidase domain-containing ABC transporter [Pleurocapsa sp. PCC 7319]|uniref:peptidase domain-containing ABC transporter n=1 Tax=Pleurocapsa sp. PCC 7319 TaxID=118161 RepID=UPI00034AAE87|nr:peptidase domain-containing ABC transporter [Pleurocapsa sp. PCC 7319]
MSYKCVLQHNEEDCGAACLATIAKHYGRNFSLSHMRQVVGTGQLGTTMFGLRRGAEAIQFNAYPVRATDELLEQLDQAPLPAIIHWKGYHWVILHGQKGKKYVVADPAVGVRYLTLTELKEDWSNGVMLLLEPQEDFFKQPDDRVEGLWQFFTRLRPYRWILLEALSLNLVVGLLFLATPILMQILTDDVLVRGDNQLLVRVAIAIAVMNLIASGLEFVQANLIAHFGQRLELGIALEFGRQILRLPLDYYETHRSNEVISRLRDIRHLNQLLAQVLLELPVLFFTGIVSLGLMLLYSSRLTIVVLAIALCMSISTILFLPILRQKTRSLIVTDAENQGLLLESFKGALTFKAINAAPQAWEELQNRFVRFSSLNFGTIQIGIINLVSSRLFANLGTVAVLWYGGTLVIASKLSVGQLVAFHSLNRNLIILIIYVVSWVEEFTRVKTAAERLTEVINASPETKDNLRKHWVDLPGDEDIICSNLNFYHPGNDNLFSDFFLTIPGGKVTSIIGRSGCGKSTLVKLIARLYNFNSGNIRYGNYNQQDLDLECLRTQVVLVPQEAYFWSRSIVDNFRWSVPFVSFEQIVQACCIAGADEFISQMPNKYDSILGEFGANISGGQKQRLALARAIANDPPVLILDESTSALDPMTEAQVLRQILEFRQGKTTIIISHRPRVIIKSDWIVLLEQGKLELDGTPEELRKITGEHQEFLNP